MSAYAYQQQVILQQPQTIPQYGSTGQGGAYSPIGQTGTYTAEQLQQLQYQQQYYAQQQQSGYGGQKGGTGDNDDDDDDDGGHDWENVDIDQEILGKRRAPEPEDSEEKHVYDSTRKVSFK